MNYLKQFWAWLNMPFYYRDNPMQWRVFIFLDQILFSIGICVLARGLSLCLT